MRINANTVLYGRSILLVPYGKHHVQKYHAWMESEAIRELTASLPLSLDDEYEMQQTWQDDEDKCTFIILSREQFEKTHDEIASMIGDVNLFLNDPDDTHCGEIEIMIAEESARKKGYGIETLYTFLRYAIEMLHMTRFVAKIGLKNAPSITLFTNKLQFQTVQTSEYFQEVTMERPVNDEFVQLLTSKTLDYKTALYEKLIANEKV